MSGLMAEREWESEETEEIRKRAGEEDSEGEEEPVGEAGGEERTGGEEWLEVSLSGEGWRREAADTMGRGVEAVAEVAVFSSGVSGREGSAKAFDDLTSSFSALLKPGMFFASSLCLTLAQLMPPPPPAFTSGVGVPKKSTPDGKLLLGPSPFPLEIGNPNADAPTSIAFLRLVVRSNARPLPSSVRGRSRKEWIGREEGTGGGLEPGLDELDEG
jgi:hypothetical protein